MAAPVSTEEEKDSEAFKPAPFSALKGSAVIVMRHGIRLDQNPSDEVPWPDKFIRPFDTPLAETTLPGKIYDTEFDKARISHFIVSPLLRTLQTAAFVALASHNKCRDFRIDDRICEDEPALIDCLAIMRGWPDFDASKPHIKTYEEVAFLSLIEAKAVIEGIIGEPCSVSMNHPGIPVSLKKSDVDRDASAAAEDSESISVEAGESDRRRGVFGLHVTVVDEALKERKGVESAEHVVIVTHGTNVKEIVEAKSGGLIIHPNECAWVAFDESGVVEVYSPSRVEVLLDPRLSK